MQKRSFFSKLFNTAKQKAATFIAANFSSISGSDDWYDTTNMQAFRTSLYLNTGVSMIRDTVSSLPLEMYRILNADGEVDEITDDPWLDLFERPNNRQTQLEFWKLAVTYYLLSGEAFWYLERENENAIPSAMTNMRPDSVDILFSQDRKEIVAYEFRSAFGELVKLRPDQVVHIKNVDPTNPARGIGVLAPATQRIISEREAARYQSVTFKTGGRPDIAVFIDSDLTDDDAEDARERWKKIYGRGENPVGFFGQKVKDLKTLNVSPREMEGMKSMEFLRNDILTALRIPKQMIDPDVNYANSETAKAIYLANACMPVLDTFLDVVNNRLLTGRVDEDKFVTYENPVQADRELILKEATQLKDKGIISVNEARSLMKYDDIEGGDNREPGTGSTLELSMKRKELRKKARRIIKKRPVLNKKFKAIKATTDLILASQTVDNAERGIFDVKRERNSVFHTKELKEQYIKAFNENIDRKALDMRELVDVYNDGFLKRIKAYMETVGIDPQRFFDVVTEMQEARSIFLPFMQSLFERVGQETMDGIASGFSNKAAERFYTPDEMLQILAQRAEFFIASMLDTDFEEMNKIIVAALAEGKGVEAIGRDLRKYFTDMSVARAKTIARTETGRVVSQATQEAYSQSSLVTGKEWMTAGDDKVRDEHRMNDGVIVATNATFPNGESYPGEFTINCRCAIAPAV